MTEMGYSESALQFLADNYDLPRSPGESAVQISVVARGNRLQLVLEIGEAFTNDQVKAILPELHEWRDRLLAHQGAWTSGGHGELREQLATLHDQGQSYARLARSVNRMVADELTPFQPFFKHLLVTQGHFPSAQAYFEWHRARHGSYLFAEARRLLSHLGVKVQEINEILGGAVDRLAEGQPAFYSNDPISKAQIRNAIRSWGRKTDKLK